MEQVVDRFYKYLGSPVEEGYMASERADNTTISASLTEKLKDYDIYPRIFLGASSNRSALHHTHLHWRKSRLLDGKNLLENKAQETGAVLLELIDDFKSDVPPKYPKPIIFNLSFGIIDRKFENMWGQVVEIEYYLVMQCMIDTREYVGSWNLRLNGMPVLYHLSDFSNQKEEEEEEEEGGGGG